MSGAMDPQTLERLLIDRSLGALDGDMQSLLDAFLRLDEEAGREASAMDATVAMARLVLSNPLQQRVGNKSEALPPLRLRIAPHVNRRSGSKRKAWISLAACLALGIALGSSVPR